LIVINLGILARMFSVNHPQTSNSFKTFLIFSTWSWFVAIQILLWISPTIQYSKMLGEMKDLCYRRMYCYKGTLLNICSLPGLFINYVCIPYLSQHIPFLMFQLIPSRVSWINIRIWLPHHPFMAQVIYEQPFTTIKIHI